VRVRLSENGFPGGNIYTLLVLFLERAARPAVPGATGERAVRSPGVVCIIHQGGYLGALLRIAGEEDAR